MSASRRIKVLIVDDHPIVREGLRMIVAAQADMECVGDSAGEATLETARRTRPDVVLMDVLMPETDGATETRRLRAALPGTQVVALSSFSDDRHVRAMLDAGAIGYLVKGVNRDEIVRAIRQVAAGRPALHLEAQRHLLERVRRFDAPNPLQELTERERDILTLIGQGLNNQAIAGARRLSVGTVKGYVSRVLAKLGAQDRTQAALIAVREGLVDPQQGR